MAAAWEFAICSTARALDFGDVQTFYSALQSSLGDDLTDAEVALVVQLTEFCAHIFTEVARGSCEHARMRIAGAWSTE